MLDETLRQVLLQVATNSVKYGLQHARPAPVENTEFNPALQLEGASFVTLKINQQLRGCIGTLEAYQPLVQDVAHNAFAAAFRDPRFAPVSMDEFAALEFHISVLSPPEPMPCRSESELLNTLRPGTDGLVIEDRGRRATFLPSVWESLPTQQEFVRHLKMKAGMTPEHWSDDFHCERYTVEEFGTHSPTGD